MNLCMALNWRSETSYTLAVQLLAADGAVISLIDRYFEPKNRLSLFHFCWVPMTVLSCIPIVVGMSITRLRYVVSRSRSSLRQDYTRLTIYLPPARLHPAR